ncbi:hypothetical protein AURDEDRAFT_114910 [Auricularia subglabra TFB-10046 SS5]|nr:hypothetical protein AURDEDRAFT_114910 [Auricularia subglabra TFB-10046 SS5]
MNSPPELNADNGRDSVQAIYVVGPSSSGKTTLCRALAARLRIPEERFVHEVARDVMTRTGFSRSTVRQLDMQRAILVAQVAAEERALQTASEVLILLCDRSAVDPLVYAALGFADGPTRQQELMRAPEFQAVLDRYRASLFVLLAPIAEWVVDDGVRSLERPHDYLQIFKGTLQSLGVQTRELGEDVRDLSTRVDKTIAWMREFGFEA